MIVFSRRQQKILKILWDSMQKYTSEKVHWITKAEVYLYGKDVHIHHIDKPEL